MLKGLRILGEGLALGLRPYRDVLLFRGRATRSETFLFLWLAGMIGSAIAMLAARLGLTISVAEAQALAALPIMTLSARRLHDIGLPGWPGPLIAATVMILRISYDSPLQVPVAAEAARWLSLIALFAIIFWPPAPGENRYGTDPRLVPEGAAS